MSDAQHSAWRVNARGIRLMMASMAAYLVNDTLVKFAGQTVPPAQLIFVRGLMAFACIVLAARLTAAPVRLAHCNNRWVVARALIDAGATFAYLTSLLHLPIANATAINMAAPLFIAVLAVVLLHERAGLVRWLTIAVGFIGVLLVIQPRSEGFNAFSVLCLFATLLHAFRSLFTVLILAALALLFLGWKPMTATEFGLLAAASVFLAAGYHLITLAARAGDLTVIAPFRYSGLLFALIAGAVIWGEWPNALGWVGIALLLAAGLWLLRQERSRAAAR
ncbi:MAG: DMT family transporter [Burkholderiales bacterium]|nr:DMT family transporter [Burkholderiales bacterium]